MRVPDGDERGEPDDAGSGVDAVPSELSGAVGLSTGALAPASTVSVSLPRG